ncbi:GPW/gp25 family protein [Kineococcus aurantiacus]|uniref:IraD/Gp25-like domain-containing protein n=1 Tax=Kineococcus aurantiacus TaxID=37633 RepID=A0A7Y9DPZ0_9ACTN|nr:GPW/gp25 family protein [Kineococcus aurantiacus]NYD24672.1 hypothetical protein [Kineococcus aurantiacus]
MSDVLPAPGAAGGGRGPVAHPLAVDARGGTAGTDDDGHLRDLIEQVLFTVAGERLHRPTLGAGVGQLLFAPTGPEVAVTTQVVVQGALQQWLGDLLDVAEVRVTAEESALVVQVVYAARRSARPGTVRFALDGGAP